MEVLYRYDCGCTMSRIKADEINDVKINCEYHRGLLQPEIKDLIQKLSLLIRKGKTKSGD